MALEVGARIGPYRVEQRIGAGGFSTVYKARDDRLDASVAIKVLADNYSGEAAMRTRFIDEARMIRKVGSEHLIGLFDVGETPSGQPYLVMQLADRGDLSTRLATTLAHGASMVEAHSCAFCRAGPYKSSQEFEIL